MSWRHRYWDALVADSPDRMMSHAVFWHFLTQITDDFTLERTHPPCHNSTPVVPVVWDSDLNGGNQGLSQHKIRSLKLNGGLGTTLGCTGAKCMVTLDNQGKYSFLDHVMRFIPAETLVFLNSYHTHADCSPHLDAHGVASIMQNRWPCLTDQALSRREWAPPGHGDVLAVLADLNCVDQWLQAGYDTLFISNIDNLGAMPDPRLARLLHTGYHALVEVTPQRTTDRKGGQFVLDNGRLHLSESLDQPGLMNTNSLWLSLPYLKHWLVSPVGLTECLLNYKMRAGNPVIQIESALGSCLQHIAKTAVVQVARSRFQPVKSQADLDRVRQDYHLQFGK